MFPSVSDSAFLVKPITPLNKCASQDVLFTWTIDSFGSAGLIQWNYNTTILIMRQIGSTGQPQPQGSYVGRAENGTNSDLTLASLTVADTGGYQCSVTYNNGTLVNSEVVSLYVYGKQQFKLRYK